MTDIVIEIGLFFRPAGSPVEGEGEVVVSRFESDWLRIGDMRDCLIDSLLGWSAGNRSRR